MGDVSKPGLGLSDSDNILLQQTVTIVYHCAANVRFDATLLDAVMTNSYGTNGMIKLVKSFTNLKVSNLFKLRKFRLSILTKGYLK